jgi:hypothetical protein
MSERKQSLFGHDARALTRRTVTALLSAVVLGFGALVAAPSASEAAVNGAFKGDAYGVNATGVVGPIGVGLGKISYIPCPCNGTKGQVRTATVNSLNVDDVLSSGVVKGTVKAGKTSTLASATNTAEVGGLNLFEGRIRANAIKAVANVQATNSAIQVNSTGSTFVNLRIGNNAAINGVPAPNTRINLAGIGEVTLNARSVTGDGQKGRRIQVDMIVIRVTVANNGFLPVGARVTIAHAAAGFTRTTFPVYLRGEAYAALANSAIGRSLQTKIGKQAYVSVPCEGTSGRTQTNNITAINVGTRTGTNNILDLDSGRTTAFGGTVSGNPVARTTSEIASVNLLKVPGVAPNGIIRVTGLKAVAQVTFANNTRQRSTNGSQFGSISILGATVPVNVPPNFTIEPSVARPGIRIKLNEQIIPAASSSDRTVVNMIKITVVGANLLNLPVGAQLIVGHADAGITR